MEEDYKKEIEKIISQLTCQKDFQCIKSGFTVVCHPRDIELELFLECWQEKPVGCQFSLPLGYTHICRCPLPLYIYKESAKRSLALGGSHHGKKPRCVQ
jgi:hypothetical protein